MGPFSLLIWVLAVDQGVAGVGGESQNNNLRNNDQFRAPFARLSVFRDSFIVTMIAKWNQLDISVRNKPAYLSFKNAIATKKSEPKKSSYTMEEDGLQFTMPASE